MKTAATLVLLLLATAASAADTYTQGYVRKDGTPVQGHYSTNPNGTKLDNYSTRGNVNPYTGQAGTVDPYRGSTSGSSYTPPPAFAPAPNANSYGYVEKQRRGW